MQYSKYTYLFLLALAFSVGYLVNSSTILAQTEPPIVIEPPPPIEDDTAINVGTLIAAIVAVTGLIGTIATILPQIINLKRNVLNIKHERDADIIRISNSVGETDDWVLENVEKMKIGFTATLNMNKALNDIITKNRDKLEMSEKEALMYKQNLEQISSVIPSDNEIEATKQEIKSAARDPKQIG